MTEQDIADTLNTKPKGSIFTVTVDRPAHTRKGVTQNIRKVSQVQGQICDYAARAPVKNAVEAGDRLEPELPSHIKESFYIGNTRFWRAFNGQVYFTVPITGNPPKVQWLVDDVEVQRDTIVHLLLASELKSKPSKESVEDKGQVQFMCVKLENVDYIK